MDPIVTSALSSAQNAAEIARQDNALGSVKGEKTNEKITKLAKDFEAIFMELMLKSMRKTVQKSGLIDGGNAEEIYQGMIDWEYAKSMADSGKGAGLADALAEQLLRTATEAGQIPANANVAKGLKAYKTESLPVNPNHVIKPQAASKP